MLADNIQMNNNYLMKTAKLCFDTSYPALHMRKLENLYQLVKLIFGEEPLHTSRKNRCWEISHIDVFEKISTSKVKGMKII